MGRKRADIPLEIVIKTRNNEERNRLGENMHNLLAGNPDYIDNAIILNIDQDKRVRIWIFDEAKTEIRAVLNEKGEN